MICVHFLVARFQNTILLIVQYKYTILVRRIKWSRIWSSAQDYAVLVLLRITSGWSISCRPSWKKFIPVMYQPWMGTSVGLALKYGCMIHRVGWYMYVYIYVYMYVYIYVYIYINTYICAYIYICIYIHTNTFIYAYVYIYIYIYSSKYVT